MADEEMDFFESCPGLHVAFDGEGTLVKVSRDLRERYGFEVGASLAGLAPDDQAKVLTEVAAGADVEAVVVFTPPAGEAVRMRCRVRRVGDGLFAGLEVLPTLAQEKAERIGKVLMRMLMSTLDLVLYAIDAEGVFVFQDGKGLQAAGLSPGQFVGMNAHDIYPREITVALDDCLKGMPSHTTNEVHGAHWESWYLPVTDGAGKVEYAAGVALDITPAVTTERELQRKIETIQAQKEAIHELSAPVLQVWDEVLAVPLIGVLDQGRTDELSERLLAIAGASKVRYAILDLTGVDTLDTAVANHLLRLLASLRLLGVEGMVTGISPQVAQTMVGLGIELTTVKTHRSLRDALRGCMLALSQKA
ncbi:MAG: STAS domain-containing protein [Myxococcales bacterium]|nr:STAS domain-containing protein [Myxococcales bacterium]